MAEVNLNDISSNSNSSREFEEKQLPAVQSDEIKPQPLKKQSKIGKALGNIGVNTDLGGAGKSIWGSVIVPALLDIGRDAMYAAADYIFGGTGRRIQQGNKKPRSGYTNYSAQSTQKQSAKQPNQASYYIEYSTRRRPADCPDDPPGAEDVKDSMLDVIDVRGCVSVQDMITIAGKSTSNFMLGNWGWTDLSSVIARKNSNGMYYLDLPKPVDISRIL